ncbi:radial spoke head protein 4 A, partial [Danaus plexippus plexippus]
QRQPRQELQPMAAAFLPLLAHTLPSP